MIVNRHSLFTLSILFGFAASALGVNAAEQLATDKPENSAKSSLEDHAKEHNHDHHADAKKDGKPTKDKKKPKTKLKIGKDDTVISVGDMHCKHCAKKMASKLYTVKGVVKVRTDVKAGIAIVSPQKKKKLDTKSLWSASQKAGCQPVLLEGPAGRFEPDPKTKAPKLVPKKVAEKPKQKETSAPASS